MQYEYDPAKSAANKEKHGIDFGEAQALWLDDNRLEIPARAQDEPRFALIARIQGIAWTAICTMRGENIRIISVRRARKEEVALYEE